ncbi:MAG: tRNA (adenosine(37)-N6)-threonylcarbamoyltransferase complex dimerization subunit type 1 TsaB [Thiotrichales bacterium]|nr:MAG: tRNA (adenosine(37)-N6)-threonylcarbamoyltransferase complex dimerization subunit type 1 TsaB [Thiotrichales bacterium]
MQSKSPTLLAIDTSTAMCSCAIYHKEKIFDAHKLSPRQHTQMLFPLIKQVLKQAALSLKDIDVIVFPKGPGSFTGIRLGVTITQGLAFVNNCKVIGISSLWHLAQSVYQSHNKSPVIVCIDAYMNEVYWNSFKVHDDLMLPLQNDAIDSPGNIKHIDDAHNSVYAVGDAWQKYDLQNAHDNIVSEQKLLEHLPLAKHLLPLALMEYKKGNIENAEQAMPVYLSGKTRWKKQPV